MNTLLPFVFDPAIHQVLSNVSVALDLAQNGVFVFPCQAEGENAKRPMSGVLWRMQSTTDPRRIEAWWERWPDAMPAIDMGKSGLIAIDCDGELGLEDWTEVARNRASEAPTVQSPRGGEHVYFKLNGRKLGNSTGSLPPKRVGPSGKMEGLDVRGFGGYVIAPGATMLDGRRYEPNEIGIHHAAEIPDWLIEILEGHRQAQVTAVPMAPGKPVSDERKRLYGERALMEEMASLAAKGVGERNNEAAKIAFRIGQLVGGGCLTEAEAYSHLHNAAASWGISANDKALGQRGTIMRAIRAGAQSPRFVPEDDTSLTDAYARALLDRETGEIPLPPSDDPFAEYAFGNTSYPDGLIAEITDWILATSRRPNRPLAMTAAIALMCGVTSRHMMSPSSSATHLYLVNLGATAVGKDRPFKALDQLLSAARLGEIYQSAKFKSDTAVELLLKSSITSVATVDEIGSAIFAKMGGRRATTHEASISNVLRELWSIHPGDNYQTASRAGERSEKLQSPALTIMGASTLGEFYKSLNGASVDNGFLNRFTVIMADPASEEQNEALDRRQVPQALAEKIADLLPQVAKFGAENVLLCQNHPSTVIKIEYATPAVDDKHLAFSRLITKWRDSDEVAAPFLGRTAEMAIRLATIHAVGRSGRSAVVTDRDYRWGASIALASARFMIDDASHRMAETDYQANSKAILTFLRDKGSAKRMEITRKVDGRWEPAMTDKILRGLIEGGQVTLKQGDSTDKGGRKPDVFIYVKEQRACV